jgi:hypothetical protein
MLIEDDKSNQFIFLLEFFMYFLEDKSTVGAWEHLPAWSTRYVLVYLHILSVAIMLTNPNRVCIAYYM